MEKQKIQTTSTLKKDEKILVVKRSVLFDQTFWTGFRPVDFSMYSDVIEKNKKFLWRSTVENDPGFKQIIPYLVFEFDKKIFVMQRKSDASEQRLQGKHSIGIGGHVNEEDVTGKDIFDWARREFHEEVDYSDKMEIIPIGMVNDDSTEVGRVHTGFVFMLKGSTNKIKIKSELKSGQLISLEECKKIKGSMEIWSLMVLEYLLQKQSV
ncbi:hypothetical protein HN446_01930 [bacterium]|jgi:predicted NUDIX family phosphoesterase|nr:hypothetical protein [bacterium]